MTNSATARIRALNDRLRQHGVGGQILITAGLKALTARDLAAVFKAVSQYDSFGPANDPYGEHDCAVLEAAGETIMFKIDYYDTVLSCLSPDPADPELTVRVMTVMLAEEY